MRVALKVLLQFNLTELGHKVLIVISMIGREDKKECKWVIWIHMEEFWSGMRSWLKRYLFVGVILVRRQVSDEWCGCSNSKHRQEVKPERGKLVVYSDEVCMWRSS